MTPQQPQTGRPVTTEMPAGLLRYSSEPEEWFPMRRADWKRIRTRAGALADPLPYLGQIGWTCVGIGASALLALAPWVPAYSQLPAKAHPSYAWVTPLLACIGVFSAIVAVFCMVVNRTMRQREAVTLSSVLSDMDECYTPYDPAKWETTTHTATIVQNWGTPWSAGSLNKRISEYFPPPSEAPVLPKTIPPDTRQG